MGDGREVGDLDLLMSMTIDDVPFTLSIGPLTRTKWGS